MRNGMTPAFNQHPVLLSFPMAAASFVATGLAMGLSTWGYLQQASLAICAAAQVPLSIAYLTHRKLCRRHPDVWSVTLAFPCVSTAVWVLASLTLPIGSTASPCYSATEWPMLIQCSAYLGRSAVTFLLSWLASAGSHHLSGGRGLKAVLPILVLIWIAGGLRFYATTFQLEMSDTFPDTAQYRVSCINVPDMEAETKKRLAAGDTIILHTERATGDGDVVPINDGLVASYQAMLTDSFQKTQQEAVVVLSFTQDQRSWYHLVSRNGSQMSYAKNHPVPLVETDILPGDRPPSVAEVSLGGLPLKVTGSICFDTDFPWLTRQLGSASLLLESSATWSNIGREHLHGHKYAALENGQTLIKCTEDGYTGAIDPFGSVIYEAPQSSGVVSFNVPRYPAQEGTPSSVPGLRRSNWRGGLRLAAACRVSLPELPMAGPLLISWLRQKRFGLF
ncbi:unnamed protein product [Effrenium voratum]|nr:unnamed protein product [Effrenium voratum]